MKKIFLTSALALCVACPAFAGITGSSSCNESTLGASEQNANVSIDATWSAKSFDVIYSAGTHGTDANATPYTEEDGVTYNGSYTVKALSATGITADTGYHFTNYSSNFSNSTYAPTNVIADYNPDPEADLTFTANFAANETTVTYSCGATAQNGITGNAPESNTATYASNFIFRENLAQNGCAKTGWTFAGWNCTYGDPATTLTMSSAFGTTGDHASDTTMPAGGAGAAWAYTGAHGGTLSCTAVFTANTINITWYDGEKVHDENTCTYDDRVTLPAQPSKTGYTFGGWTVRQNSGN